MSFGAYAELACFFASVSVRPTSPKSSCSTQWTISGISDRFLPLHRVVEVRSRSVAKFSSILSMSRDRVIAGAGSSGQGLTYKDAGVDIDAGSELVRRIVKMAPGIGGFGGLFPLGKLYFGCQICHLPLLFLSTFADCLWQLLFLFVDAISVCFKQHFEWQCNYKILFGDS